MKPRHYRQMIIRAVQESDATRLDAIVDVMRQTEAAKQFLCALGYGEAGQSIDVMVRRLPSVKEFCVKEL